MKIIMFREWCKTGFMPLLLLVGFGIAADLTAGEPVVVNGYVPTPEAVADSSGQYVCLTGKTVQSYWEYPTTGDQAVSWKSAVVPVGAKSGQVVFRIACGLGTSKGETGLHQLFINNHLVCDFNTPFESSKTWTGPGGSLTFSARFIDANHDLFGIMRIKPKPAFIEPGRPQEFKVVGKKNNSRAWFMLSSVPDAVMRAFEKRQSANLGKKIAAARQATLVLAARMDAQARLDAAEQTHMIRRWHGGRVAAVSLGDSPVSAKGVKVINFFAKGKKLPLAANNAVDAAVIQGAWLNEIWPRKLRDSNEFRRHCDYLRALSCVLWQDDVASIRKYVNTAADAEVDVRQRGDSSLQVQLKFSGNQTGGAVLTLRIPLPRGTWEARVLDEAGREVGSVYCVQNNVRMLQFDFPQKNRRVIIEYTK